MGCDLWKLDIDDTDERLPGRTLRQPGQMRLRVTPRLHEFNQVRLTALKFRTGQSPAKQFVPEPEPVRVEYIGFAVLSYLRDVTVTAVFLDFRTGHAVRFS